VAEHDALERLGSLAVPALVIAGENDLATPLPAKQALAAAIPGARLVVLPGAPHMMHIEQPDVFLRTILDFLGDTGSTTP
jgi:3-oxoadipate enol-lactonase